MMRATVIAAAMASTAMGAQFVMYTPGGDDTAIERMDSIVSPGEISAHMHQIFGANKMSPDMTYDSLQESDCTTVGNAAGDTVAQDHSVYWHPSLFAESSDGSGYVRIPTSGHKLYYRDVGNDADDKVSPFEFPKGFRMVAGHPTFRAPNSNTQQQTITEWICHGSGSKNLGDAGGFPKGVSSCDSYPGFAGSIHFPHCWNGKEFDLEHPYDHVSYPEGDIQGGPCPASHPKRVPHIFLENFFDLSKVKDSIKQDTFVLAQGDATGYGWHADFVNGWESGAIPELFDSCPQPYYGNSDIGTCPSFKKGSSKNSECKLKISYKEDTDGPLPHMPGCNPITDVNPAPKMAIAKLGECTDKCPAAGSGLISSGGLIGNVASALGYGSKSSSAPSYNSKASEEEPSTTLATYVKPTLAPTSAENAPDNLAYVTEWVTVTADSPAATPAGYNKRHVHRHVHKRAGKL